LGPARKVERRTVSAAYKHRPSWMKGDIAHLAVIMFSQNAAHLLRHEVKEEHLAIDSRCRQIPPIARDLNHPGVGEVLIMLKSPHILHFELLVIILRKDQPVQCAKVPVQSCWRGEERKEKRKSDNETAESPS